MMSISMAITETPYECYLACELHRFLYALIFTLYLDVIELERALAHIVMRVQWIINLHYLCHELQLNSLNILLSYIDEVQSVLVAFLSHFTW